MSYKRQELPTFENTLFHPRFLVAHLFSFLCRVVVFAYFRPGMIAMMLVRVIGYDGGMRGTMLVPVIRYDGGMRGTMLVRVIRYDDGMRGTMRVCL